MMAAPEFIELSLPGLWLCTPRRLTDGRGWFAETYSARRFNSVIGDIAFRQDNAAYSRARGVLRGLHFQIPPMDQAKLVQVLSGSILDVVVDLRRDLPSFGRHLKVPLSAETGEQLFIPSGFAHGYVCLEPDCTVSYKVSNYYSPEHERSLAWNDPALGIDWTVQAGEITVSPKDASAPSLKDLPVFFGGSA